MNAASLLLVCIGVLVVATIVAGIIAVAISPSAWTRDDAPVYDADADGDGEVEDG